MEAAHLIVQHDTPDDWVVGTGEDHSVQEFVEEAFGLVGLDWERYVRIDPRYFRPAEVDVLRADASKVRQLLGWKPNATFHDLVHELVAAEMAANGLSFEAEMPSTDQTQLSGSG
jgi:GDPmannose 4,6-dehydratase